MIGYLRTLLLLYRRNVRVQPMREAMAILGIAAGVALLFTVQVAHRSITGSFAEISNGVTGRATLELAERGPGGFSERISNEVAQMRGVQVSAPMLQEPVVAVGPRGRRALTLVAATPQITSLGGKLAVELLLAGVSGRQGLLVLTEPTAHAIGVAPGDPMTVLIRGQRRQVRLNGLLTSAKFGPAAESPVAAAPLPLLQALTGQLNTVSRVLIEPVAGKEGALRKQLQARFGTTVNVRATSSEAKLLANATRPERQITLLFSAISILAGIILAYASLLLASDERRRFAVYLIEIGTPDSMIITSLVFDALLLGIFGSIVGLVLGDAISLFAFRSVPGYIAAAFPVGGQRVVGTGAVLFSIGGGLLAAFIAAALPAVTILRAGAASEPNVIGGSLSGADHLGPPRLLPLVSGIALICGSVALCVVAPGTTIVALLTLAVGLVLSLPRATSALLRFAQKISRHSSDAAARLSLGELRRTPTRGVALLATGAIATFLTVTIGGSVADVQHAVSTGAAGLLSNGELWVKPGGPENVYATQPLATPSLEQRVKGVADVKAVDRWQDSFLDLPHRRVWIVGVPTGISQQIAPSQLVSGSLSAADRRLKEGGWVALSQTIAREDDVSVGGRILLPTPSGPIPFRVAATVANYGWLPGAIVMNGEDHVRYWKETSPTQLAIALRPGISLGQGKRAVEQAIPTGTAVFVRTATERQHEVSNVLGSTLSRLNDTTLVVLIATIVSITALIVAAISQRRGRLDSLQAIGMSLSQFCRLIFYESGSMLLAGCCIGFAAGVLSQALVDGWLRHATGAPVHFSPAWQVGLRTILITAAITLAASAAAVVNATRPESQAVIPAD
jgi:putative ABC transport system permease protein